jgi:tetratricopeptide (TPR) repeat protein
MRLGEGALQERSLRDAVTSFCNAVELASTPEQKGPALRKLGVAYRHSGRFNDSIKALNNAALFAAGDPALAVQIGQEASLAFAEVGEYDHARTLLLNGLSSLSYHKERTADEELLDNLALHEAISHCYLGATDYLEERKSTARSCRRPSRWRAHTQTRMAHEMFRASGSRNREIEILISVWCMLTASPITRPFKLYDALGLAKLTDQPRARRREVLAAACGHRAYSKLQRRLYG